MTGAGEFAGTLTERVSLERRTGAPDEWGALPPRWERVATRWASVERVGRQGSREVGDTRHRARIFHVRMRAGPHVEIGMRMLWKGREMLVVEVDDLRSDILSLTVEEMR